MLKVFEPIITKQDISQVLKSLKKVDISGSFNKTIKKFENNFSASCITSSWESGPLTLFESLSAGMPVICRSIPAIDIYGFSTCFYTYLHICPYFYFH